MARKPGSWSARRYRSISREEYVELATAVLREAWRSLLGSDKDLQSYPGPNGGWRLRPAKEVAREWFEEESDDSCFSFETICEVFGVDSGKMRRLILSSQVNGVRRKKRGG